jgi:hypothetical protein
MESERPVVVLVTGAAPYLGGPATWAPLRAAAPEYDFLEVDLLGVAEHPEPAIAARALLADAVGRASALVAHATAAGIALEVTAHSRPDLPVVLVSPVLVPRSTPRLRLVRAVLKSSTVRALLTTFARAKHRRLRTDPSYLKKQLAIVGGARAATEVIAGEALARFCDLRAYYIVERTPDLLSSALEPLDAGVEPSLRRATTLLGTGPLDRKIARRMPSATVLESVTGAPMLDAPGAVARALRASLGSASAHQGDPGQRGSAKSSPSDGQGSGLSAQSSS